MAVTSVCRFKSSKGTEHKGEAVLELSGPVQLLGALGLERGTLLCIEGGPGCGTSWGVCAGFCPNLPGNAAAALVHVLARTSCSCSSRCGCRPACKGWAFLARE